MSKQTKNSNQSETNSHKISKGQTNKTKSENTPEAPIKQSTMKIISFSAPTKTPGSRLGFFLLGLSLMISSSSSTSVESSGEEDGFIPTAAVTNLRGSTNSARMVYDDRIRLGAPLAEEAEASGKKDLLDDHRMTLFVDEEENDEEYDGDGDDQHHRQLGGWSNWDCFDAGMNEISCSGSRNTRSPSCAASKSDAINLGASFCNAFKVRKAKKDFKACAKRTYQYRCISY